VYLVTDGEDINGTAKCWVSFSLQQFAINSARQQFVAESVRGAAKDVSSSVVDNNEQHSDAAGEFCDRGARLQCESK